MSSTAGINLSVGNIPPAATRLVAVVDGGSISGTLRGSQDVSAGIGSSTFSMGVPSGGPYRIRVIAFTSGSTFPAVLRSGKTTGVSVSTSGSTSASVTLGDVTGAVDPSTPTSASAGAQVTIKINITDPGDFLAGVSSGRLWSSTSPLTQNTTGAQTSGTLSSLGNGVYQFAGAVNLPTSGGTFYYQFGEASFAFDNPNGTEAPFLDWPNLQTGGQALQIAASGTPSISGLNPSSATAGGPALTLVVNGSGFLAGSTVQWNGSAMSTTYFSGAQLTAAIPANLIASQGAASVTVLNPGGMVSNAITFTITAPTPNISGLSPSSVTTGGPAFTLTVNGTGFLGGATVQWNGLALSTTYLSSAQLTASVPANLIAIQGTASVRVLNPGGATSSAVTFTITAPTPNISGLSPNSTTAGGPAFTLTVSGSGFLIGSTVQWNGSALSTSYLSGNQLTAAISGTLIAAQGTATIMVANPAGAMSNSVSFTINAPVPISSTLSPTSATAGGPQFTLTVNGSGFLVGSAVQWNGSALPTSYASGTQLTATVSANLITNAGNVSVRVQNPGGAASNALTFPINQPTPAISSLSPNSATAGRAGFTVAVNGSGFLQGSTVQWNGTALATSYVSGSQLTASVSANLIANAGSASVTVANPGGNLSNVLTFTISTSGLSIITASSLPAGTIGVPYSEVLAATGGVTPYKNWAVIDPGDLPLGVSLTTIGDLTGTPTTTGTFTFTAQVTDNANSTATKLLTLTINGGAVSISANGIVNAASYAGGSVSPGEIVVIFGSGFGPNALVGLQLDGRGYVSTSLANTQVLFDGVAAPMIYTLAGQVSVVVPYEVSGKSTTQLQVVYQSQSSSIVSMPVSTAVPGIFTSDASGRGLGAIINQDGTVNSSSNPAPVGSYISVYATGEGQTNPEGVDGKPGDWPAPLPVAQPVTAMVGGLSAPVQYAGGAPGLVAGVLQVNVQIPQAVPTGSSVPIIISVGGQNSQANVTLAIK